MRHRIFVLVAGLLVALGSVPLVRAAAGEPPWKGSESLALIELAPNFERCGQPPVLEARFAGDGVDTVGGVFTVTASACVNPQTLQVTKLEATDRFGVDDALLIAPGDVTLTLDDRSCVATNLTPVPFSVAGGTGRYADAQGHGTYHIALNWPACNGVTAPARVWFEGTLTAGA